MNANTATRYDLFSVALHWLTAVVVVAAFVLAPEDFGDGVDPSLQWDVLWHESLGLTVLVLTLVRLLWVALRPAAPRFAMPTALRLAAKAVHCVLWALLLALPVSALLMLASEGHPLTLLGGVRVDAFFWLANAAITQSTDWRDVHTFMGDAVMVIAGLHALAAICHHLVRKDGVLLAMLPGCWGRSQGPTAADARLQTGGDGAQATAESKSAAGTGRPK